MSNSCCGHRIRKSQQVHIISAIPAPKFNTIIVPKYCAYYVPGTVQGPLQGMFLFFFTTLKGGEFYYPCLGDAMD